jgi:hypothetical protein
MAPIEVPMLMMIPASGLIDAGLERAKGAPALKHEHDLAPRTLLIRLGEGRRFGLGTAGVSADRVHRIIAPVAGGPVQHQAKPAMNTVAMIARRSRRGNCRLAMESMIA